MTQVPTMGLFYKSAVLTGFILAAETHASVGVAVAGEIPDFLSNGKTYATTPAGCAGFGDSDAPDDALQITAEGIWGYEFGCTFVEFLPVRMNSQPGNVSGHVAIASCGDDSGISRPDLINMSFYDNIIYATSQNDYVASYHQEEDARQFGIVEKSFALCQ